MRILVPVLLMACSDYEVKQGKPDIAVSTDTVDFGEVVLGHQSTIGIQVSNEGMGTLELTTVALDESTADDFTLLEPSTIYVERGESVEVQTRYAPGEVGQDFGLIGLSSNDEDEPYLEVGLEAFGVEPLIDVDPELLYFGTLTEGEEKAMDFQISAGGTGSLTIQSLEVSDERFSLALPVGVTLPYDMVTGISITVDVLFTASGTEEVEDVVVIASNDPTTPEAEVNLLANTKDDPTENAPPVVEITDPDAGDYFLMGDTATITAVVYDEEDAPESLLVAFYADGSVIGSGIPDGKGLVELETAALPVGEVEVVVRAIDTDGETGEDAVDIKVWNPKEPIEYVISGGTTLFDYWSVDDDVTIYLNGTAIYQDTNHTQDNHPPVEFEAEAGDEIRIVAEDVNECTRSLDPLTLHFGTGYSQELNEAVCESTCPDDPCYDPDMEEVWPNTFFDETFTIEIP